MFDTPAKISRASPSVREQCIVLSDESYAKAVGLFRMQVGQILKPFDMYGLGVFIGGAMEEITKLAEDFGLVVRGVDKPLSLEYIRRQ